MTVSSRTAPTVASRCGSALSSWARASRGGSASCRGSSTRHTFSASRKIDQSPLYRRICYTFAWSAAVVFGLLNLAGLTWAIATGEWRLRQIYDAAYFPLAGIIWILGAGDLSRA